MGSLGSFSDGYERMRERTGMLRARFSCGCWRVERKRKRKRGEGGDGEGWRASVMGTGRGWTTALVYIRSV